MTVDIIQFMKPNGNQKATTAELPDEFVKNYTEMRDACCRFEAEVLRTDEVSITISNKTRDVDIEVVENGPAVQAAMIKMLERRLWNDSNQECQN